MNTRANATEATRIVSESIGEDLSNLNNNQQDQFDNDDQDFGADDDEPSGKPVAFGGEFDEADDTFGDGMDDDDPIRQSMDRVTQTQQQRDRQQRQPTRKGQQQQRPQPQQDQLHHRAEVRADARGNLVNAAGEIVAKAGREARFYQSWQKSQRAATRETEARTDLQNRFERVYEIAETLNTEIGEHRARAKQIEDMGLSPQEHVEALSLYVEGKTNPRAALQKILTRAAANGINVAELGGPAGVDPKQLTEHLTQTVSSLLKPIQDEAKARKEAQDAETRRRQELGRTQRQVETFFKQNPEARRWMPVFRDTLADPRYRNKSLDEIWMGIRLNLAERRNSGERSNPDNTRRRQMPRSGRRAPAGQDGGDSVAPVSMDYGTILDQVLNEQGVRR